MSEYSYLFDYTTKVEHYPIGNHDYFYPNQAHKLAQIDRIGSDTLSGGVRIAFLPGRYAYKQESLKVTCLDTSNCYQFETLFILPVQLTYTIANDPFGPVCSQNYVNILISDKRSELFKLSEGDIRVKDSWSIKEEK